MIAVAVPAARAKELARGHDEVLVGADNGPATVLTGPRAALAATAEAILAAEPDTRIDWLPFDTAFHSPAVMATGERFAEVVACLSLQRPKLPVISTVSGAPVGAEMTEPGYWGRQIWQSVRFADATACLPSHGVKVAIELGPTAVLAKLGRAGVVPDIAWLSSLRADCPGRVTMLEALAGAWTRGIGFDPVAANGGGQPISMPTYPWQRQRFWADEAVAASGRAALVPASDTRVRDVGAFYSGIVDIFAELNAHALAHPDEDLFLTLAPFPEIVPGFSWIQTNRFPDRHPDHVRLFLASQRELRALLFRHVDFAECRQVLDLGCGHGADLVALARRHRHLRVVGQTIAAGQAEVAREKVQSLGLEDRIDVRVCDSTTATSNERFDLALGFEVIHHVPDKQRLFATLAGRLADGALLVAADFIAEEGVTIDDTATLSSFLSRSGWSETLAASGFEVVDAHRCKPAGARISSTIPTSRPTSKPCAARYARLRPTRRRPGGVRLRPAGRLLREGLATYVLLTARYNPDAAGTELQALNHRALGQLIPYDVAAPTRWLYEVAWRHAPSPAMAEPAGSRLLLLAGGGLSCGVGLCLAGSGFGEVVAEGGLTGCLERGGWRELVDLRALDAGAAGESPAVAALRLAAAGRRLAQALGGRLPVRLVTRGAVATAADEPLPAPAQAALWGLAAAAACRSRTACGAGWTSILRPTRPGWCRH